MIPLVDLKAQYHSIKSEIDDAINGCISEGNFIRGKQVSEFEQAFSKYLGISHCIGCANGTDAIEIILLALGIGRGDEVIVPALTWISTAEAVSNVGAEPVFVDINEETFTIDHHKIAARITKNTKAIIPVHLYGSPAQMDEIMIIAQKHSLYVVEDCAQAHGAEYKGKKVGTFGIASSFSFFPSKNLGAFGDSGAIVTNDKELADKLRRISNHGQLNTKHEHSITGRNSRLDTLQAAILNAKLPHLNEWNRNRICLAGKYSEHLSLNPGIKIPQVLPGSKHVFHLYVIRCKNRDNVMELLARNGVSCTVHYPEALPFVGAYKYKAHSESDFPVSVKVTREILSIPLYPELTESNLEYICKLLNENL
jgi:dTDP-4-amino-4,6-dideoxygalactose transaminase